MNSLLNCNRPPVFCPGCTHERVVRTLDNAFQNMGLRGNQVVIVSDIGCSGLFDTFFHTHALHGLHGRALTYAAGLKLAKPELNVIVTMGDGGQGIGGAHLLAACRRNLDLTLLVLNNFNFGMTGGQFSATTPIDARVGSGFLNQLERPLDICQLARAAGAPYVLRCSGYRKDLAKEIEKAIRYKGFSVVDIWGICPGRYTKRNRLTPKTIEEQSALRSPADGIVSENVRSEFGQSYRDIASRQTPVAHFAAVEAQFDPPEKKRQDIVMLGSAGQRILTAGEILCLAGMTAGLNVAQKNEYNITVLRGPSISELILSPEEILYTGIENASIVLALGQEGVERRIGLFDRLDENALIIQCKGIELPATKACIHLLNPKRQNVKAQDEALACLSVLAKLNRVIHIEMLQAALALKFKGAFLSAALELVDRVGLET